MRRLMQVCVPLLLTCAESVAGQALPDSTTVQPPPPFCYRARPRPACSGFMLTNYGGYLVLGRDVLDDTPFREVADWGLMANVSDRDAVGASLFASLDRLGFAVGPAVHYRRWLSGTASLEVAAGMPLMAGTGNVQGSSVLGLLKWSPNDWFALAARPELLRRPTFSCGPTTCVSEVRSRGRVSLGVEFGAVPGLALTGVGSVATFLLALAALAGGD